MNLKNLLTYFFVSTFLLTKIGLQFANAQFCDQNATLQNFTNNTVSPIPDSPNPPLISTIVVAGAGAVITDVNLTTFITHTFSSDLDITLTSPAGTTITITTDNGGGNDDVFNGTLFDDSAGDPVTDHIYTNLVVATPLSPEEPLAAFFGQNPNGIWTLTIGDDAGLDTGNLNSWSLAITTVPLPVLSTPPLSFTNNTVSPIPDSPNPPLTSTIVVAGAGTAITDVNLTTFITHTFSSDLDITLTSPAGTTITITTDNGGSNDNVFNGTLFDDSAGDPVTDHIYTNLVVATPLSPEAPLAAFFGENPNGIWTLTIADDAGLDAGNLNSWSLQISTCLPPLPTTICDQSTDLQSFSSNIVSPIPDSPNPPLISTIVVAGAGAVITDVNLTTFITHTFSSDLDITLTSPAGTTITISTDNGGANDDVFNGTLFDDSAGDPVTDHIYTNLVVATPLSPEEPLAAFFGQNPNGIWTLTIGDDAGLDTGNLNSWSLAISTVPLPVLSTPPLSFTNNTVSPIPDSPNPPLISTIVVAGAGTAITDVNLTTFITHTFNADLDITLASPAGTTITITTDNGGGNDDVFNGTLFDDSAGDPVTDHIYTNLVVATPLSPEEPLAAFFGQNPNGIWTLTIADDAGLDTGNLNSWSLQISTCSTTPPNDDCANAIPLTCGDVVTGSTTNATLDGPAASCTGGSVAPDVWYTVIGNGAEITASLCTGTTYDSKIDIYTGSCAVLTSVVCDDDFCSFAGPSQVTWASAAATTYFIRVHGFAGSTGNFELAILGPANDVCTAALPIACGDVLQGSTLCATADASLPFCGTTLTTAPGVWYIFNGTGDNITFSTCSANTNYDTKIGVFEGSCATLTCIAGNDDDFSCGSSIFHSSVNFCSVAGLTYYIYVTGFGSASGNFELSTTCTPIATNDNCVNSILAAPNVAIPFNNTCTTTDGPDEPGGCTFFGYTNIDSDIWYTYFNQYSGDVTVSLCGSLFDTKMAIYQGAACPLAASAIACNDDFCSLQSEITFNAACNTLYHIRIGGFSGAQGSGQLLITPPPPYTVSIVVNNNVSCAGFTNGSATAIVSGGTPPFSYLWNNGETNATATALAAGSNTVSVTDANGCVKSATAIISQPLPLNCNIVRVNVDCFGTESGSATVSPTGGTAPYNFLWSTGATTASISNLPAGNYSVTVTDTKGCVCINSVTITQPPLLQIVAGGTVNDDEGASGSLPSYLNTHTIIVAGGASPYSFSWNSSGAYALYSVSYGLVDTNGDTVPDEQGATITIIYADEATWSMVIDDTNGCGGGNLFTVSNNNPNIILDIDGYTTTTDNGGMNGSLNLSVSGGIPCPDGYNFSWEGPSNYTGPNTTTTGLLTGLPYGWYVVTVTDCSNPQQTTVGWFWVPKQVRGRGKLTDAELINAYPNPAGTETTVEFSPMKSGNAIINLYSISGQHIAQLYKGSVENEELYTIPVSVVNLPAGMYIIRLQTDAGEQQQVKLTVAH